MTVAKFFTDKDVYAAIAMALRKSGLDALSTPEAGRIGESDESQLAWAAREEQVLLTFNVAHFAGIHAAWMWQGRHHAGIVLSCQRPIGELLRRLFHLSATLDADNLKDRLEYVVDW